VTLFCVFEYALKVSGKFHAGAYCSFISAPLHEALRNAFYHANSWYMAEYRSDYDLELSFHIVNI